MGNDHPEGRIYPTNYETNRFMRTPYWNSEDQDRGSGSDDRSTARRLLPMSLCMIFGAVIAITIHILFWH